MHDLRTLQLWALYLHCHC